MNNAAFSFLDSFQNVKVYAEKVGLFFDFLSWPNYSIDNKGKTGTK